MGAAIDPAELRRSMRASVIDGSLYSVMVGIGETYLPAFVLALGMGEITAGLIAALPQLAGALIQLISPWAVAKLNSHKRWVVMCAAIQGLSFFPLIFAALIGKIGVVPVFLLATIYWAGGLGAGGAWNTWMGRLIPASMRTKYFAKRSSFLHAAVPIGVLGGGLALQFGSNPAEPARVFAILFLVAGICRLMSARLLSIQCEPPLTRIEDRPFTLQQMKPLLRGQEGRLLAFIVTAQLAVQIGAPYFSPYMLKQLHLPYAPYMVLLAASFLGKFAAMPFAGRLAHRYGTRTLLRVGAILIVPLPVLWLVSGQLPYLICMQLAAGAALGSYELATLLMYFEAFRSEDRTALLTLYNLGNSLAIIAGSLVGASLLKSVGESPTGYSVVFAVSLGARLFSTLLLRHIKDGHSPSVRIATGTIAVRPSAGTMERPFLTGSRPDE